MPSCGRTWQPRTVDRVIELFGTSTRVAKVATDAGNCFLKGMGNPAGNESLSAELVGSELACLLGLKVPPFAIVKLAGIEIVVDGNRALETGPAFVSSEIRAHPASPGIGFLDRIANPHHIPLLVAFDTWIRNADRCPPSDALDPSPNWDNLLFAPAGRRFEMMVIDHTHSFVEEDLESGLAGDDFADDDRIYGAFSEFRPLLSEASLRAAANAIARIDAAMVEEIVHTVPVGWGPTTAVRERWIAQLMARSSRIEEYLICRLVRQHGLRV